jgi:hypothetical protein
VLTNTFRLSLAAVVALTCADSFAQWVSKLLDWTHDDFDLQRFLQDDGSWPPQPQLAHTTSSPPRDTDNLELSVAHYYRSHSHFDVNAPDSRPRQEMPLVNYYKQCGESDGADRKPTGFFGGVFENGIFSRLAAGQSHIPTQESRSEPEPEPELDQERERAAGTNFIHSVLGRLSPFEMPVQKKVRTVIFRDTTGHPKLRRVRLLGAMSSVAAKLRPTSGMRTRTLIAIVH